MASGTAMAAEPTGDWRTEDGSAIIRVDNCRGALWGVVAWERSPAVINATAGRRWAAAVLINMRPSSQARWDGQIYNAQNGQTYKANVRMVGDNTLRVEGCVMGGVFCGGQRWTRVGNGSRAGRRRAERRLLPGLRAGRELATSRRSRAAVPSAPAETAPPRRASSPATAPAACPCSTCRDGSTATGCRTPLRLRARCR